MNWFFNLKVAQKITVLVMFLSVFLCITSYLGFYFTTSVSQASKSMYYDSLLPVEWLNQTIVFGSGK